MSNNLDLICFSHLRWGFVYQRPQHLMSRFAKHRRVFFFEEPVFDSPKAELRHHVCPQTGVHIVVPALPEGSSASNTNKVLRKLLVSLLRDQAIRDYVAWFYTPMALSYTAELRPAVIIYDCMDELSLFHGAPPELLQNEKNLFERADLVFTGGLSLFEAKCERHKEVYAFPSSVDVPHFAQARIRQNEPADQANIPHPRIGYAGVIDERMDTALLQEVARLRPEWQIVLLGPVVKISETLLPKAPNIHYLGMRPYAALPAYFSGWDAAMLPFALNEATRFISPTKTPEYLAAGLPVISTPIRDVVRPYGDLGLARIAKSAGEFAAAMDHVVTYGMSMKWRERADAFLSTLSWDHTWNAMNQLIVASSRKREPCPRPEPIETPGMAAMEAF
jgi:UDP-galactopyranose mutase